MDHDWPDFVSKPDLPDGYRWVCLRQAMGIKKADGGHPWYVRVTFDYAHKKLGTCSRHLKFAPDFSDSPIEAINAAMCAVKNHQIRRNPK